jgi:hypothetical protein
MKTVEEKELSIFDFRLMMAKDAPAPAYGTASQRAKAAK